jgi:HK97 family phage prohead protease
MGKPRRTQSQSSHEQFRVGFTLTDASLETGTFKGVASVFGSPVDTWTPTVVDRGAFTKTLVNDAKRVRVLYQHDPYEPIGKPIEMRETDLGLEVLAKISPTDRGRDCLTLMRDGVIDELSIGFDPVRAEDVQQADGSMVRHLTEIRLWEFSPVTFAADPNARINAVHAHAVVSFQDLPLGDEGRAWDKPAAEARVRSWAGGGDDVADMDWAKYRKAFVWYDASSPEQVGSYKLMIGDIIDGGLKAVPRGVYAAAGALQGARGGVNIPADDKDKAKAHLGRYYKKLDKTAPWDSKAGRLIEDILAAQTAVKSVVTHAQADPDTLATLLEVLEGASGMICSAVELLEDALGLPEDEPTDEPTDQPMDDGMTRILPAFRAIVSRETHEGRVLSKKNATLVSEAIKALQALLDAATIEEKKANQARALRVMQLRDAELAFARSALNAH